MYRLSNEKIETHIIDEYAKILCVLKVAYLLKEHSANSCGIENRQKLLTLVVPSIRVLPLAPIETRDGWPALTVETVVNGASESTNETGLSLVGSLGLSCLCKRFELVP